MSTDGVARAEDQTADGVEEAELPAGTLETEPSADEVEVPGPAGSVAGFTPGAGAPESESSAAETAGDAMLDLPLSMRLEALLLVADEPIGELLLAELCGVPPGEVVAALAALADQYDEQERGFDLRPVAGGWRFYTRAACAPLVERFVLRGQTARMTQAALETLAVVAYRQPVTRGRVAAVRGVNVDGVMRTLLARGLIAERGSDPESSATLYGTTPLFLERLGLNSLDELPSLAPFLPDLEAFELDQDSISS